MLLEQAIKRLRVDLDDLLPEGAAGDDPAALWTDDDLIRYLEYAEQVFLEDALTTPKVLELDVVAGEEIITLQERVFKLRTGRGYLRQARTEIHHQNVADVFPPADDYGHPTGGSVFRTRTSGRPHTFVLDADGGTLTLIPPPREGDVLVLPVYVTQALPLAEREALAVRNPRDAETVLVGAKAQAYMKHDADTYDPNKAERLQEMFDRMVSDSRGRHMRRHRRAGVVRYGGI